MKLTLAAKLVHCNDRIRTWCEHLATLLNVLVHVFLLASESCRAILDGLADVVRVPLAAHFDGFSPHDCSFPTSGRPDRG